MTKTKEEDLDALAQALRLPARPQQVAEAVEAARAARAELQDRMDEATVQNGLARASRYNREQEAIALVAEQQAILAAAEAQRRATLADWTVTISTDFLKPFDDYQAAVQDAVDHLIRLLEAGGDFYMEARREDVVLLHPALRATACMLASARDARATLRNAIKRAVS